MLVASLSLRLQLHYSRRQLLANAAIAASRVARVAVRRRAAFVMTVKD